MGSFCLARAELCLHDDMNRLATQYGLSGDWARRLKRHKWVVEGL